MRLCIPTDTDRGLDAAISAHFGSAPYLTLVDGDSGRVQVIVNRQAHHAPGSCDTAQTLPGHDVRAVVCLGLGRRAFASLQHLGIEVFVTDAARAGAAAEAFQEGALRTFTAADACGGGRGAGHRHGAS
jgi:predicted Fe-Mo cluster-binding NifX family protein